MSMERARRERFTNIAPSAGEFAATAFGAGVFFFLVTPLVVQAVVSWVATSTFALPTGHLLAAYGSLLQGHFGAGLPAAVASQLPADAVMWVLALIGEGFVLGAAVVVGMWMRDMTGASTRHGLATASQAAEALGVVPLRKRADQIRPDLYPSAKRKGLLR